MLLNKYPIFEPTHKSIILKSLYSAPVNKKTISMYFFIVRPKTL